MSKFFPRLIIFYFLIFNGLIEPDFAIAAVYPKCSRNLLKIDIDLDNKIDCVKTEKIGSETALKIWSTTRREWIFLQKYNHSDEYLKLLKLNRYKNSKFDGPHSGFAIKLIFPEKSSVIFYWDRSVSGIAEFWESD